MQFAPNIALQRRGLLVRIGAVGLMSVLCVGKSLTAVVLDGQEAWFQPAAVTITTSAVPGKDFSRVAMAVTKNGDARIESSGSAEGKSYAGSLMLISGNRMLARDVSIEPGAEIDALDGPVLQVRLALELLGKAFPGGPASLTSTQTVNVAESKEPIRISTMSASGQYSAPWTLKGTARSEASAKSFDFAFTCAGLKQPVRILGSWSQTAKPPDLPDSLPVNGWRVFSLGPYSKRDGGGTIYDYGAQEIRKTFGTLGDVRRYAARQK